MAGGGGGEFIIHYAGPCFSCGGGTSQARCKGRFCSRRLVNVSHRPAREGKWNRPEWRELVAGVAATDVRVVGDSRFDPSSVKSRLGVYQEVAGVVTTGKVPTGAAPTVLPTVIVVKRMRVGNSRSARNGV